MPGPHSPQAAGTGPDATAPQGLLHKVSAADTGVIDRPVLTPHLEYRILDEERVLLVSESFNTLLHGPLHGPLLALLDGQRTHDEIAEALGAQWAGQDPETVLKSLEARGYLVSGDYCMAREQAAWWSSLGASPRFVEECLGSAGVSVDGDEGGALIGALESLGVAVDSMGRELRVVVCEDYLDAAHADTNRAQMDSGQPWMLARPREPVRSSARCFDRARAGRAGTVSPTACKTIRKSTPSCVTARARRALFVPSPPSPGCWAPCTH